MVGICSRRLEFLDCLISCADKENDTDMTVIRIVIRSDSHFERATSEGEDILHHVVDFVADLTDLVDADFIHSSKRKFPSRHRSLSHHPLVVEQADDNHHEIEETECKRKRMHCRSRNIDRQVDDRLHDLMKNWDVEYRIHHDRDQKEGEHGKSDDHGCKSIEIEAEGYDDKEDCNDPHAADHCVGKDTGDHGMQHRQKNADEDHGPRDHKFRERNEREAFLGFCRHGTPPKGLGY